MLAQAIVNLFLNAIDADDGGVEHLHGRAKDNLMVFVEITDNGVVSKKSTFRLFSIPFSRKKYGTGLGLAQ